MSLQHRMNGALEFFDMRRNVFEFFDMHRNVAVAPTSNGPCIEHQRNHMDSMYRKEMMTIMLLTSLRCSGIGGGGSSSDDNTYTAGSVFHDNVGSHTKIAPSHYVQDV